MKSRRKGEHRTFLQNIICVTHIYLGGLVEGAVGVDVVVKDDDPDHHPHAKQNRVLTAEATWIFPKCIERLNDTQQQLTDRYIQRNRYFRGCNSRCLQHDFTDAGHCAETVCGVLQWEGLILHKTQPRHHNQLMMGHFFNNEIKRLPDAFACI